MPPFENHVPLAQTAHCLVFMKACQKLDHIIHFGFHGNRFKCIISVLRWLKCIFLQKHQTKGTVQVTVVLVFNES